MTTTTIYSYPKISRRAAKRAAKQLVYQLIDGGYDVQITGQPSDTYKLKKRRPA